MTKLNDRQEHLLSTVEDVYLETVDTLTNLEREYEHAIYIAKKPIRTAVEQAEQGGVPFSRITSTMGFNYPQKLKGWLRPADSVVDRLMDETEKPTDLGVFEAEVLQVQSVSRDSSNGVITVHYLGEEYKVSALGPDTEPWATKEPGVPDEVYKLIEEKFPGFVALEDEED